MVFNRLGRLYNHQCSVNNVRLEVAREYKYLGIVFTITGKFSAAVSNLYYRGQKAYFKLCNIFKDAMPKISTFIHTFNHTVKPVLLYGSEIWGMFDLAKFNRYRESPLENMFKDSFIEKLNIRLCKFLLGVSRKASNLH